MHQATGWILRFGSLVMLTASVACLNAQDWRIYEVDSVGFIENTKLDIALDADDIPHFAYGVNLAGGKWVTFAGWDMLTESPQISYIQTQLFDVGIDLLFDHNNLPHLSYHSHQPVGTGDNVVHLYNDGDEWINENIFSPGHDGWSSSIQFDSDNQPHISFIDPACCGGDSGAIEYAWFDGAAWNVESVGVESELWIFHGTSLALDSEDTPHISFYDDITQDLMLAVKESEGWILSALDTTGNVGRFSALYIDSLDNLHLGYYAHLVAGTGVIKYGHLDGAAWQMADIDTLTDFNTEPRSDGMPDLLAFSIDRLGRLHLSYSDRKMMKLAIHEDGSWKKETIVDFSESPLALKQQTSMVLDGQGLPHIAYCEVLDVKTGSSTLNMGRYAVKNPYAFHIEALPLSALPVTPGDTVQQTYTYRNFSAVDQSPEVWATLEMPGGGVKTIVPPRIVDLIPAEIIERSGLLRLPSHAEPGTYSFISYIGTHGTDTVSTDTASFEVVSEEQNAGQESAAQLESAGKTAILANHPNPFNPTTSLRFQLAGQGPVQLTVFDIQGRRVRVLIDRELSAGLHDAVWNGDDNNGIAVASGIYFGVLETQEASLSRRMLLLK